MALTLDVAHYYAVIIEMWIYGIYTTLFCSALPTMAQKSRRSRGNKIYLIATLLMFGLATFHICLAFFRFVRGYVHYVNPLGPAAYLYDFSRWENILDSTVYCTVVWVGDFLVIYRCYYVWNRNFLIVSLPIALVVISIGVNVYSIWWFAHPDSGIGTSASWAIVNSIFPLAFSQNFITTSFITLKIYKQHQISTSHGIVDRSSKLSLLHILRIIIESAMLYTIQWIVLMILYYSNNNGKVIVQNAIVPTVGIVFILMSLRIYVAKSDLSYATALGTIPDWLTQNDEVAHNPTSLPGVVNFRLSQTAHIDDAYSGPFGTSSYPHKNRRSVKNLSRESNTL